MKLNDTTLLKTNALIDGEWVPSDTNDVLPVKNPATGDIIAEVAKSSANQTKIAIDAAADAMEDWKNLPAKARANLLRTWFELMMTNQEDLAKIMTAEQGKTLAESRGEIAYGAAFIEWFGEQAKRLQSHCWLLSTTCHATTTSARQLHQAAAGRPYAQSSKYQCCRQCQHEPIARPSLQATGWPYANSGPSN